MLSRIIPSITLVAALSCAVWMMSSPVYAGSRVIRSHEMNFTLGLMVREFCVETFPRFAKAESILNSKPYFQKRAGQKVWDHTGLAVAMELTRVERKPACVMHVIAKRYKGDAWAYYAVPAFGATWESDETIVDMGKGHTGDHYAQHMLIRYPTHQYFKFDADLRDDGLWAYKISFIAK